MGEHERLCIRTGSDLSNGVNLDLRIVVPGPFFLTETRVRIVRGSHWSPQGNIDGLKAPAVPRGLSAPRI
jgi:hypothetical protein